jgi:galactokinase
VIRRYVVPGRVELVGKHVDYAGGRSLTCAVDLALHIDAETMSEPVLRVDAGPGRGSVVIPLDANAAPTDASWSVYVAAVARRFARDFPHFRRGVSVRIGGDLPEGAGLSSSSALIVALGTALSDANNAADDEQWSRAISNSLARAEYFAAIETGAPYGEFGGEAGVGVRGGAQDPIAIICGEASMMSQFSYLPARLERRVPWPADTAYRLPPPFSFGCSIAAKARPCTARGRRPIKKRISKR